MANDITSPSVATKSRTQRSTEPQALRRPIHPDQLRQLICSDGHSYNSAATILGVCPNTVKVAAVRFGIKVVGQYRKIDPQLCQEIRMALEQYNTVPIIAQRLGLSESSIYRFLRMHPDLASSYKQRMLERDKLVRRMRFLKESQTAGVTSCSDYYWLRRNDAAWIAQQRQTDRQPLMGQTSLTAGVISAKIPHGTSLDCTGERER